MKKASVIALILGILMIVTSVVLPLVTILVNAETMSQNTMGIIGGADGPTAILVVREALHGFPTALLLFGIALVSASIVTFIICKKKKR